MNKSNVYVAFISLIAALGGFLFGFDTAVISGTIGLVKEQFNLNDIQQGWFVSSALVGSIVGVLQAGFFSDKFGRKPILIVAGLLFFLSALGCAITSTHEMLIIYRIIGGIAIGIASMLSPMYIAEVSPSHIRGRLVSVYQFAITIGILISFFTNAFVLKISEGESMGGLLGWLYQEEIWRGMFANGILPALIFVLLLFFIPESPRWLISKDKGDKAEQVMRKMTAEEDLASEIETIKKHSIKEKGRIKDLFKPGIRKALLIGIFLPMFSQLSGINVVIYYGPEVLKQAGFSLGQALDSQVLIGVVNVLFTIIAIWLVDKLGRKPLLLAGLTGIILSLSSIGISFFMGYQSGLLVMCSILVFIACFAFSLGAIPWIVISEIFPTNVRGRAMSVGTISIWGTNAVVQMLVPLMLNSSTFGASATFGVFAVCCFFALLFTIFIIPETKQKSLEEIEDFWKSRSGK